MIRVATAAGLGVSAGFVSGLFGIGGGTVMVPGLVLWLGLSQHRATATSVTTIIATASASLVQFAINGEVQWDSAALLLLGALTGAYLGASVITRVPPVWIARGFLVLVLTGAARMWFT